MFDADRAVGDGPAPLAELRAAVAFLTRLPVGLGPIDRSGAAAFGLVGAGVGVAGALPLLLLGGLVPLVAAVLALATLAVVTGALHVDGLADTADALLAVGPGAAERARKDPAAGPGGVVAVVLTVAIEVAALGWLVTADPGVAAAALVSGAGVSRSGAVLVAFLHHPAAAGGVGTGERFADGVTGTAVLVTFAVSGVLVAAAAVLTSLPIVLGTAVGTALACVVIGGVLARLRHQLDGDGLGATVELSFAAGIVTGATIAAALGV
jgi:adenosylcobinamide-GDP ribazoletransferase